MVVTSVCSAEWLCAGRCFDPSIPEDWAGHGMFASFFEIVDGGMSIAWQARYFLRC